MGNTFMPFKPKIIQSLFDSLIFAEGKCPSHVFGVPAKEICLVVLIHELRQIATGYNFAIAFGILISSYARYSRIDPGELIYVVPTKYFNTIHLCF